MWPVVGLLVGSSLVAVAARPGLWSYAKRWISWSNKLDRHITTRVWAQELEEDEHRVLEVWTALGRAFSLALGCVLVGASAWILVSG